MGAPLAGQTPQGGAYLLSGAGDATQVPAGNRHRPGSSTGATRSSESEAWRSASDIQRERRGAMSNHFSGGFKFPGDDARLDLTDVFAFVSPEDPTKAALIIDVNPFMTAPAFHPDAVYRINVDNDGDAHADVAFTFVFSKPDEGRQTAAAYLARGSEAEQPEGEGYVRMCVAIV